MIFYEKNLFCLSVEQWIILHTVNSRCSLSKRHKPQDYFSPFYDVSINYLRDKDTVDYLVLPEPFAPFDNENNLPIIKVPSKFFLTKDFEKIKDYIDDYFKENAEK